jgi:hypothetical protein
VIQVRSQEELDAGSLEVIRARLDAGQYEDVKQQAEQLVESGDGQRAWTFLRARAREREDEWVETSGLVRLNYTEADDEERARWESEGGP